MQALSSPTNKINNFKKNPCLSARIFYTEAFSMLSIMLADSCNFFPVYPKGNPSVLATIQKQLISSRPPNFFISLTRCPTRDNKAQTLLLSAPKDTQTTNKKSRKSSENEANSRRRGKNYRSVVKPT